MDKAELAQVLDRAALDASDGARGRLRIEIPAGWAEDGGEIEIVVPSRIACARCDGGGCDGCARSGAHRAPDDAAARTVRVRLPARFDGQVQLRLVRPFGADTPIEQLLVEICPGGGATPGVAWLPPAPLAIASPARPRALAGAAILGLLAVLAAIVGVLASR